MQPLFSSLVDPITHEIFRDPVQASDKQTYERSAILQWWERCDRAGQPRTSPITREPMTANLVDIPAFKRLADEYVANAVLKRPKTERAGDSGSPVPELADKLSTTLSALDTAKGCMEVTPDRPPQFVFLGDENSGKSTLIERLTGMQLFPADGDRSTQMIVKICLRRAEAAAPRLVVCLTRNGLVNSAVDVPPEGLVAAIQSTMQKEVQRECAPDVNGVCQHSCLTVYIKSPTLLDVDLVELPGIHDATTKMAEQYLNDVAGRACYVIAIPAHVVVRDQSAAFQLIQRRQLSSSSIVVFTKADLAESDAQPGVWEGILKQHLRIGVEDGEAPAEPDATPTAFAVTMNGRVVGDQEPPAGSFFERVQQQAVSERQWFEQHGTRFAPLKSSALSCDALVEWMAARFREHYPSASWLKELLTQLETKQTQLSADLQTLGVPRAHDVQSIDVDALVRAAKEALSNMAPVPVMQAIAERLHQSDARWTGAAQWTIALKAYGSWTRDTCLAHMTFLEKELTACESIICERVPRMLAEDRSEFKFGRFAHVLPVLRAAMPDIANAWRRHTMQNLTPVIQQHYELHFRPKFPDFAPAAPKSAITVDLEALHNKIAMTALDCARTILLELARHLPVQPHYWLENCAERRTVLLQQLSDIGHQIAAVRSLVEPPTTEVTMEGVGESKAAEESKSSGAEQREELEHEELAEQVASLMSNDVKTAIAAATYLRKIVRDGGHCTVQAVIDAGVVPRAVELLHRDDQPDLQKQACAILSDIAAGTTEQTRVAVDAGAVPSLIQLLGSSDHQLPLDAVWTLANIIFDGGEQCGLAIRRGLVPALLLCATSHPIKQMTRAIAWTFASITKHCDYVESLKPALPWLASAGMSSDVDVLTNVCSALGRMATHCGSCAQAVLDTGVAPRLLQLLSHALSSVRDAAVETVKSICAHAECAQVMVWLEAARPLKRLLTDPGQDAKQSACGALANIMRHGAAHGAAVLDDSTLTCLVDLLADHEAGVAKAAVEAISAAAASDAATVCESGQRRRLMKRLSDLLATVNEPLRAAVIDCSYRLLSGTASSSPPARALDARIREDVHEFGLAGKLEQLPDDERNGERVVELLSLLRGQEQDGRDGAATEA